MPERHSRYPHTRRTDARRRMVPVEVTYLPGLDRFVRDELRALPGADRPEPVPGRNDSFRFDYTGPVTALHGLRTAVAAFRVLTFEVARPKSLLHGDHLRRIAAEAGRVRGHHGPPRSFRIDAPGRDSPALRRLIGALAEETGLPYRTDGGDLLLRLRRTPGAEGWDVLVRTTVRPLSARAWRMADYRGAANATVAAAMARAVSIRPRDRVANLMCGSGTLLIERLLAGPCRAAVGVDRSPKAVAAARANLDAADLADRAEVIESDIADPAWIRGRRFDAILADPPWGTLSGDHRSNEELHDRLLRVAHDIAAPGARLAVLTHEIKLMERILVRHKALWRTESVQRVFQKGHHPRIYLLRR